MAASGEISMTVDTGAEVDGGQVVAHLVRVVAASEFISLTQLALFTAAPTFEGGVVQQGAGVGRPGGDGGGGAARSQIDGGEVVAHLSRVVATVVGVTQPQLPWMVAAPALDSRVVQQSTCVSLPGGDGGGGAARS